MGITHLSGLEVAGVPTMGIGALPYTEGATYYFVNGTTGSDGNSGEADSPLATVGRALTLLTSRSQIGIVVIAPGSYDESITISRPTAGSAVLTLVGAGPKGSVALAPTATNASALVNHADDVTLINVGLAAVGTGVALTNTGSRLRLFGCKLENDDGTGKCAQMTLGTVAQEAAGTRGNGADCLLSACEFAWAASGIELVCTDYGAVTELQVVNCWFHDLDTNHIYETVGSGGSAAVMFATLRLSGNIHQTNEAGTAPAKYVLLNGDNANSGLLCGCTFPQAANGGKVLLSTALVNVGTFFTGGISTGQPS
jgi:hypothetical protein